MSTAGLHSKGQHGAVAVVDDDPSARLLMRRILEERGYEVLELAGGRELLAQPAAGLAAVCLDLGLDDVPGLDLIHAMRLSEPDLPIVVVTVMGEVETAVAAMRLGAYDYLVKPIDRAKLVDAVERAVERRWLLLGAERARAGHEPSLSPEVVGRSPAMQQLALRIERILDSDVSILLHGEPGTGKELVARAIHARSKRAQGPFVRVSCAALPELNQEADLFGREQGLGAAHDVQPGRLEAARGGVLFLDDVSALGPASQAGLLAVLQERRVRRVGGAADVPVDLRLICATQKDLPELVKSGRFREDLYYRLSVYPLRVPPLRERMEDLPLLVSRLLEQHAADFGRPVPHISSEVLALLAAHGWPGNVRELDSVVHHALLAADGGQIELSHLPEDFRHAQVTVEVKAEHAGCEHCQANTVTPLRELERREIRKALKVAGGSVGKAAKLLGMGRATLYRRLAEEAGLLG